MKTVAGVFSTMIDVERAVRELERVGVPNEAISIIAGDEEGRHKKYLETAHLASRSTGAAAASEAHRSAEVSEISSQPGRAGGSGRGSSCCGGRARYRNRGFRRRRGEWRVDFRFSQYGHPT